MTKPAAIFAKIGSDPGPRASQSCSPICG